MSYTYAFNTKTEMTEKFAEIIYCYQLDDFYRNQ